MLKPAEDIFQLDLELDGIPSSPKDKTLGRIEISPIRAKSLLTKGTGFIAEVDYSINPYRGCAHNCSFCYAAAFSPTPEKKDSWGFWVDPKINAPGLAKKLPARSLHNKRVVLSSVTDPYQAIEKDFRITRQILEALIPHQPQLIIQTHGILVTRDIDLLTQFTHRAVNISITTDCEEIRHEFEPATPSIAARLQAIETLEKAGINTRVTIAPMLPIKRPKVFAKLLLATGCTRFATQYFHDILGDYRSSTRENVLPLLQKHEWSNLAYLETAAILTQELHPHPLYLGDNSLRYDLLTKAEQYPTDHPHRPHQKGPPLP